MTGFLHVFRWDAQAIAVPPGGQPRGVGYRKGTWMCVMCKTQLAWCVYRDLDHADDCPGRVDSIPDGALP
jgi:hypothetical protein